MPRSLAIKIVSGDETTGIVTLDPAHEVSANRGDEVTWSIAPGSNVTQFKIKKKRWYFPEWLVFSEQPSDVESTSSRLRIHDLPIPTQIDYYYSIHWRAGSGGRPKEHDPKIPIMPSLHFTKKEISIIMGAVGLLALAFLLKKRYKG